MRNSRAILTPAWNSRFLPHSNCAIGDDVVQHAARDARRCADQEEEWVEVLDAVFGELVGESRHSIDAGGVEEALQRGIDGSAQTYEEDAAVCKRPKRSARQKHQLDAEVGRHRNVNHRWLMHRIRRAGSMMEDVLAGTIIRLRQSGRMQELLRARRKLEASGTAALR